MAADVRRNSVSSYMMLLSVVMPVFNERATIREIIEKVQAVELDKELIIVDD